MQEPTHLSHTDREILRQIDKLEQPSRAALAKALGLTPPTISERVSYLVEAGIIEEIGVANSTGGRRAKILAIKSDTGAMWLVDCGSVHARLGLADANCNLLAEKEIEVAVGDGPQATLDLILENLQALHSERLPGHRVLGIGMGIAAPLDRESGEIDSASRMPGWNGFNIRKYLEEAQNVRAVVANDANVMALGQFAQHPQQRNLLTVKAARSVGAGIIVDGNLVLGATGGAGDLAHARVPDADSEWPCACGNTGCLDTLVSGEALCRKWREQGQGNTLADLITGARNNHPIATNLVRQAGRRLGQALCSIVGILNPDTVALGGLLSTSEVFVMSIKSALYDGCHPIITRNLQIVTVESGDNCQLIGAAHMLRREILSATL